MKISSIFVLIITTFSFIRVWAATSKGGNYAVIRGQSVKMSCIPADVQMDKSKVFGRRFYVWTDEEGKEIVNPRMDNLETGELQINHAHEGDSGIYHCKFRPPAALQHDGAPSKIFIHKLIVYELSGHKFQTLVSFDVTQYSSESTITWLRDMLKKEVCAPELCAPGPVTTENCEVTETEKQMCTISMTYEALEPPLKARCDESCARQKIVDRLKKAQKILESSLLRRSEDSKSRLKPDMKTFDTKHVIICRAGYRLIESNYEHCFPCLPGTYSEAETLSCEMCPIGFYEEKYGSRECEQCKYDLTTESVGAKSRDECRPLGGAGIFKSIANIFRG